MFYATTCVGLRYGPHENVLSGFSWEHGYHRCRLAPGGSPYCRCSAPRVDLPAHGIPTAFNVRPSVRGCVTSPSPRRFSCGYRNLYRLSIGCALRLLLRPRLTLIRLALIRNPWSFGEGVSRPLCRYLYLHLLFRGLQRGSRHAFHGYRNAPLPAVHSARLHVFGTGLMPDYYPCGTTRLVSCYALFK